MQEYISLVSLAPRAAKHANDACRHNMINWRYEPLHFPHDELQDAGNAVARIFNSSCYTYTHQWHDFQLLMPQKQLE